MIEARHVRQPRREALRRLTGDLDQRLVLVLLVIRLLLFFDVSQDLLHARVFGDHFGMAESIVAVETFHAVDGCRIASRAARSMRALLGGSRHAIELCRVAPDVAGDPTKIGLFGHLQVTQ